MMTHWIKIIQLSKALAKINFSFLNFRYRLKKQIDFYTIILTCFILSIVGVVYYYYFTMIERFYLGLTDLGINTLFLRLVFCGISVLLTVMCVFLLMNIFCFSKDTEQLQIFPMKPSDIFTSKYIVAIFFCYGIEVIILLPVCIAQIQYLKEFSILVTYLSTAIILPHIILFPLAFIVTACLKISILFKGRKLIFCIIGITIYLIGIIGYRMFSISNFMSTEQDSLSWLENIVTPFPLFNQYIALPIGLQLSCIVFSIIFTIGYYSICDFVIGKKYAHYGSKANIKQNKLDFKSSAKLKSYLIKEYKIFFRNPVYVINGLFGILITPFLLPLSFRIATTVDSISQIRTLIATPKFSIYAVMFALAVVILTLSINVIASSSFSREGAKYWIAKIIPYSIKQQAFAKFLFSTSISAIGIVINCLIFKFYFQYDFIQITWIALFSIMFAVLWNLIGIFIDMKRPKLDWTNESEAIKQNINVLLSIVLCICISILFCVVIFKMVQKELSILTIICFMLCSLFTLIFLVCKGITLNRE